MNRKRIKDLDFSTIEEKYFTPGLDFTTLFYTEPGAGLGYHFGTITDIDDPAGLGRLRVHLPGVEEGAVSDWAPLLRPFSSNGGGAWFYPKPGDKVFCGFIEGKPEKPVVIGFLYTSECTPPVEQDDENNLKMITSPSGSRIELTDKDGEERITIVSKDGTMLLDVNDTSGILVKNTGGDIHISCKGFTLTGAGEGSLEFEEALDVEAKEGIDVEAEADVLCQAEGDSVFGSGEKIVLNGSNGVSAGFMPLAAKDDRVIGLDIHKEVVPVGSGTVDIPFPHLFNGKLKDGLSENVMLGDRNVAVKGSVAEHNTGHILWPPGVKFCEQPEDKGEVNDGTCASVLVNGKEVAVFLSRVKECSDWQLPFIGTGLVVTAGVPLLSVLRNILMQLDWGLLEDLLASIGVLLGELLDMICAMLGGTWEGLFLSSGEMPCLQNPNWNTPDAVVGEEVILSVGLVNQMNSAGVCFTVWSEEADRDVESPEVELLAWNKEGHAQAVWHYEYIHDPENPLTKKPRFLFTAKSINCEDVESGFIEFSDTIEIDVFKSLGIEAKKVEYILIEPGGAEIPGDTGESGKIEEQGLIPGEYKIKIQSIEF